MVIRRSSNRDCLRVVDARIRCLFSVPVLSLSPEARYDLMCQAFGGHGHLVRSVPEISSAVRAALAKTDGPSLVNVLIATDSERKPQPHHWLTRSKV